MWTQRFGTRSVKPIEGALWNSLRRRFRRDCSCGRLMASFVESSHASLRPPMSVSMTCACIIQLLYRDHSLILTDDKPSSYALKGYLLLPLLFLFSFFLSCSSLLISLSASPIISVPTLQLFNKTPFSPITCSALAHLCLQSVSLLL
jgi:hypothetical protein